MANQNLQRLLHHLDTQADRVFDLQTKLTSFRAVGPENGGPGEGAKGAYLEGLLKEAGITDIVHVDAADERVPGGVRPNIVATLPGKSPRALWLFAHMDVVPEGEIGLWKADPWTVRRDGDLLLGRGVEDNQQGLVSALVLALSLRELGITPELTLKLVFMSDEERGNTLGLAHVLRERPDLFPEDDLYVVPDSGSPDGTEIEIAEKSVCWFKVTVKGRQCHASTPNRGANAFVAASHAVVALGALDTEFAARNDLFDPAVSTFTPTRHENNVDGVNILPGQDVFWLDCRILPGTDPVKVRERIEGITAETVAPFGCTSEVEVGQWQLATETRADSRVVRSLEKALAARGVTPRRIGIGGSTVACLLREKGLDACVWSTIIGTCHQPEEVSSIRNTLADAGTFGRMVLETEEDA